MLHVEINLDCTICTTYSLVVTSQRGLLTNQKPNTLNRNIAIAIVDTCCSTLRNLQSHAGGLVNIIAAIAAVDVSADGAPDGDALVAK